MASDPSVEGDTQAKTLLLVEDETLIALAQQRNLARHGYEVITAHSADAAIELATRDERVRLVLMDIDLGPGLDGTEAASRILEKRDVPIVFLTGHAERETVERVKGITRYGYVLKSAGEFVLAESIAMAFELWEAHREIVRSRDHYESVVRLSGEIIVRHDAAGRWEFVNRVAREFWGLPDGELAHHDYRALVHPDDATATEAALTRMQEQRTPIWGLVNRQKTPRGWRAVEWNSAPILSESGAFIGFQATGRDVTEREGTHPTTRILEPTHATESQSRQAARSRIVEDLARETLRGASPDEIIALTVDRLHSAYHDLRVAYSTLDSENALTIYASAHPDSMPDITGISADLSRAPAYLEALRRTSAIAVADTAHDARLAPVREELEAGNTRALLDVPLVHREGIVGLICLDAPHRRVWTAGDVATLQEIAHYLTLALRATSTQSELEAERWRLDSIIRATNVGTWEWNVQTGETVFNETWARIVGYTLDELAPVSIQTWLDLVHPDDASVSERELDRHFRGETEHYDVEVRMRHKDGSWVWVHDRGRVATRSADGSPEWMFGTHAEITRRKRAEEQARSLLSEKDMLLREVHHRVKNNMNTLQALLSMQAAEATNPDTASALEEAAGRVQSMAVLYDRLHSAGRTTAMSVGEYLEPLVQGVLPLFPAGARVAAKTEFDGTELDTRSLSVVGTIVNELLTNAMKYAYPGEATGTISVHAHTASGAFVLEVADDGTGMDASNPADAAEADRRLGSGLNLVHLLVEQLGGSIRQESENGTRFVIELRPRTEP